MRLRGLNLTCGLELLFGIADGSSIDSSSTSRVFSDGNLGADLDASSATLSCCIAFLASFHPDAIECERELRITENDAREKNVGNSSLLSLSSYGISLILILLMGGSDYRLYAPQSDTVFEALLFCSQTPCARRSSRRVVLYDERV